MSQLRELRACSVIPVAVYVGIDSLPTHFLFLSIALHVKHQWLVYIAE